MFFNDIADMVIEEEHSARMAVRRNCRCGLPFDESGECATCNSYICDECRKVASPPEGCDDENYRLCDDCWADRYR